MFFEYSSRFKAWLKKRRRTNPKLNMEAHFRWVAKRTYKCTQDVKKRFQRCDSVYFELNNKTYIHLQLGGQKAKNLRPLER